MGELYKGQAGSPITYLTSDISAAQTTISVADDSALPDAPNICTIGYGEQLETIKYEVKSNGVLQEVTRGIEGTAQNWQAGTEVARFFTAYDHNSIIEDFVAHKAEDMSDGVHGMGSIASKEYEEGVWTPILRSASSSGEYSYNVREAIYVRMGNNVIVQFAITISDANAPANEPLYIGGLPFSPSPGGQSDALASAAIQTSQVVFPTGYSFLVGRCLGSGIGLYCCGSDLSNYGLRPSGIKTGSIFRGSAIYKI